jgi:hypothetical protein
MSKVFEYLSHPETIREVLGQVYANKAAIDEALVRRIRQAALHPHAVDAFVSMFLSPRGERGLCAMAEDVSKKGIPICLIQGACERRSVLLLPLEAVRRNEGYLKSRTLFGLRNITNVAF